jgi:glycosyltransferase involved in cell wall biosynthesis
MENQIAVTVIIPTYNRAHTIQRCLRSVLCQSYEPVQVLVVDDASTDNTRDRVLSVSDARIKYIRLSQNSGSQAARNEGIRQAKGAWIAFQDSDDEWLPDRLRLGVKALAEMQFCNDVVVHGNCMVSEDWRSLEHLWQLPIIEGEQAYKALLSHSGPVFPALLVAKAQLLGIGLLDEAVPSYQEWDTTIMLAKRCRFRHIREPLFIYHKHGGDTISKSMTRDIRGYEYVIRKHEEETKAICGIDVWEKHLRYQLNRAVMYRCWDIAIRSLNELEKSGWAVNPALKAMVRLRIGSRHIVHAARASRCFHNFLNKRGVRA